jgi:8-oxo-dGTP pyrophosphatase MutT (NUDIX family)
MYDDEFCLARYRALHAEQPDVFANPEGCPTQILFDPEEIRQAQAFVKAEREAAGYPTIDLRVGVLGEDHYLERLVRDAVRFADGRLGLYNRVLATGGVVILPILNGDVALIHIFRHAARRWFLEAPQGYLPPGGDPTDEARKELLEEMEAPSEDIIPLGTVYTSTALTSENLKVFAARITSVGKPQRAEGIDGIKVIPRGEIDRLIIEGRICDGPTTTAITRARLHGLL